MDMRGYACEGVQGYARVYTRVYQYTYVKVCMCGIYMMLYEGMRVYEGMYMRVVRAYRGCTLARSLSAGMELDMPTNRAPL